MAYSEDATSAGEIRAYLKEKAPHLIFISRKECHHDCFIYDPSDGRIIAGSIGGKDSNHDLLDVITSSGFNLSNPRVRGFGLTDKMLHIHRVQDAENHIYYYEHRGSKDHKAADYLRAWRLELQELRGEI